MKRWILILALVMMVPGMAHATSQWAKCGASTVSAAADAANGWQTGSGTSIGRGTVECFYFDADDDSGLFVVLPGVTALIQIAPDLGNEGLGNAAVMIQKCIAGTFSYDAQRCVDYLGAALDGSGGSPATQTAAARLGPGIYSIRNSVTANSDEACVSIEGE